MANNVNTNLTQRIFAYISHSGDLNARLAQVYENSLIFVGDEKQIYVPKFGAYVGIGMTSYNNTVGRIDNIAEQLAELKKTMNETAVKKLYVDFGVPAMDGDTQIQNGNKFTPGTMGASVTGDPGNLSGEVIITGKADMNPTTFFKNNSLYTYSGDEWVNVKTASDLNEAPTSGIRISYTSESTYVTLEGGIIAKQPMNQRLVIDDSLTWSYMTHAYAYTLGFTKDYTSHEIETLYQTLLGIGESVLMPVSTESLWNNVPNASGTTDRVWTGGTVYYRNAYVGENNDEFALLPSSAADFTALQEGNLEGWTSWNGTGTEPTPIDGAGNFYKIVTNYQDSYNTNISDGIQTLKEVAHILDIITDGGLGNVTYIDSATWNTLGLNNTENVTQNGNAYTITNDATGTVYHRVIVNGVPTTNPNSYGWYIAVNTENLGIQMATSIASNTAAISDLHDHVALTEEGQTTLRSLSQYNPSQFITMSQWTNRPELAVTDTNQSLPGATNDGQTSYMIGDVKTMTSLTVASTYITFNGASADYSNTALNGEERIGLYQLVDTTKFPEWDDDKYFTWNGTAMVPAVSTDWPISTNPDTLYDAQNHLKKFYTINTGSVAEAHINDTFTWASQAFVDEHTDKTFYVYNESTHKYDQTSDPALLSNAAVKKYYITQTGTGADYVLHANTTESNRLATTAWTMALVDDRNANLQNELDNILEEANKYTDEKINALDANYKYRDFASYFNTVAGASSLTYGTSAYINLWNEQYAAWTTDKANNGFVNDHAEYVADFAYNKVRSEFITNVIEENGMVTAESRELPTDELIVSYNIWNTQRNSAVDFEAITGTDEVSDPDAAITSVEELFGFVYDANGNVQHEIYYSPASAQTYKEWSWTNESEITGVYKLDENGNYVSVNAGSGSAVEYVIKNNITNSPHWPGKMYKLVTAYYEVDLKTINVSQAGNADSYITDFKYMGPDGLTLADGFTSDSQPTFYKKVANDNPSIKYISGHVDHFSYVGDGDGQNRFYIDAHITHIEDAAHNNTGLVDAYDVQNYIQNMFSWVDIYASINDDVLSHEDDFYTLLSTKAATSADVTAIINGKTLYKKTVTGTGNNQVITFSAISNPSVLEFAKDSGGNTILASATGAVPGSSWFEVGESSSPLEVYECTERVFMNPMNMTLHKI